jgi:hypothetical protein
MDFLATLPDMTIKRFCACGCGLVLPNAENEVPADLIEWLEAHSGPGHYYVSPEEWKQAFHSDNPASAVIKLLEL